MTLNRRSAIIMAMTQKIKQIPFTVIISAIFVLAVLVVAVMADPVGALGALFLIALVAAVMRIAAYIFERT